MKPFLHKSLAILKKSSPTVLTIVGAAGVIVTAVLAVRATPKVLILCERLRTDKEFDGKEEPTKFEYVKETWKCYIPAAVAGISTIACIFGANILNKRQQAVITSAYVFLDNAFKEYKAKVKELYGEEADVKTQQEILKEKYKSGDYPLAGDNCLFYEELYDKYFERTRSEVAQAEAELNKQFAEEGFATLNDFYRFLGLETTSFGDFLGWSYSAGSGIYGYAWIDFEHLLVEMNDGMECYLIKTPSSPPTPDYLSGFESSSTQE